MNFIHRHRKLLLATVATLSVVIAIFAAVVVPRIQADMARSQVISAFGATRAIADKVAVHALDNDLRLPQTLAEVGYDERDPPQFVAALALDGRGVLTVTLDGLPPIQGRTFELVLDVSSDGADVACRPGTLDAKFLPAICR